MQNLIEGWGQNREIRRTCMLMITHACNLNCIYCYEPFKSSKKMNLEDAKKYILQEVKWVRRHKTYSGLEIDLMGGEPMTNFPMIRQLVEWAEDGNIPVPYIFFATTNGTLFSDEVKDWLKKHQKTISFSLSYDGIPSIQQANRGTKSTDIDIDFFISCYPKQSFHMTISKSGLHNLANNVIYILKRGATIDATLAKGLDWTKEDAVVYREQLEKLAEAYLEDETLPLSNILSRPLDIVDPKKDRRKIKKFCGTGTGMIAYDTDGNTYGCHMFSPIVLGDRAITLAQMDRRRTAPYNDPDCVRCVLKHYCPTCAGFNYRYRGGVWNRDKKECVLHLAQAKVTAIFQLKFMAKRRKRLTAEEAGYATTAKQAWSILSQLTHVDAPPYY